MSGDREPGTPGGTPSGPARPEPATGQAPRPSEGGTRRSRVPARLWWRWSLRDLRRRWFLVAAVCLVTATGVGVGAALGSTADWRRATNEASFAALNTHDVQIRLSTGTTVPPGTLADVVAGLPPGQVTGAQERLVVPTLVEAPAAAGGSTLVPGQATGIPVTAQPRIDEIHVYQGRTLEPSDADAAVAVAEVGFARATEQDPGATVTLAGDQRLRVVGQGHAPEDLIVAGPSGAGFFSNAGYAILYVPLAVAQRAVGAAVINDIVITLTDGVDPATVRDQLAAALAARTPPINAEVTTGAEMESLRVLTSDIDGDSRIWGIVSALVLLGAGLATFNLIGRMVEQQRREIGIGMALGVSRRYLAVRPLALAAQVATLGALLGIVVALAFMRPLAAIFADLLPMPEWRTPLSPEMFLRYAALGAAIPLVAAALPVWRAVRVEPVDAIRTGHLAVTSRAPLPVLRRVRIPGGSLAQMPLRNVARAPRRTALTAFGLGATVTVLVALFGMIDSFGSTIGTATAEAARGAHDRVTVSLATFGPVDGPTVTALRAQPAIAEVSPGIVVPATARSDGEPIDLVLRLMPFGTAPWTPTVRGADGRVAPERAVPDGIVLAEKAAKDLGVAPGDSITLEHLVATPTGGFGTKTSTVTVAGIHPGMLRTDAYLDSSAAPMLGLAGLTNVVDVLPAPGYVAQSVSRAAFGVPGVASTTSVVDLETAFASLSDQFVLILQLVAAVVLALALLIGVNSAGIAADERAREHATMLAFGVRPGRIVRLMMAEGAVVGVLGTAIGVVAGYAVTVWVMTRELERTVPYLGVDVSLSLGTVLVALALGVVAAGLAPIITWRRLRRLDVPSTLRLVE